MPRMTRAVLVIVGAAAILIAIVTYWSDIVVWATAEQRAVQARLALTVQAVRSGDQFAVVTLLGACLVYGLLHAIGPGHGKFLIGGAAVASRRTAWRMATIGFASSLMQAASAIVLAYGGLGLASLTGSAIIGSAQGLLMPVSFAAMALVGVWFIVRGSRLIKAHPSAHKKEQLTAQHSHNHRIAAPHSADLDQVDQMHSGQCSSGCKHMPTVVEAEEVESWRDIVALVLSIGVRPCSGALIVLIISWHLGIYVVGALATLAMAVGTGLIVGLIALFATTVRDSGFFRLGVNGEAISLASFGRLQVLVGGLVVAACLALVVSGGASATAPMGLLIR
ncbi:MAG: nickel/cobalt transporter [Hyphomicrobiaceae bacterium]